MATADSAPRDSLAGLSLPRRLAGALFLLVSVVASLGLSLLYLGHISLPGCGPESPCETIATGNAGRLADLWPVSFLGVAYFVGLLAAWVLSPKSGVPSALTWLVRLGLVASLWWLGEMYLAERWCWYCIAVHAGNIAFWVLLETSPAAPSTRRSAAGFVVAAILVSVVFGVIDDQLRRSASREGEAELAASIQAIVAKSRSAPANLPKAGPGFIGRHRKGPEKAAIRLVFFTDYECAHCQTLDSHIASALRGRSDVCVSIKHFPLSRECNPTVIDPKRHALACRAARIAEAAGLLGGDEAFWFIHTWLMRRRGRFTDAELARELESIGLIHAARFQAALNSKEVADCVRADVEEGMSLGIRMTPTLYVNGVELNGLNAQGAVQRAIDALTAENLQPLAATADRPETRDDRLLKAWREQPILEIPADRVRWTLGPLKAPLQIVLFNDCLSPEAKETTRNLTDAARGRTDVRIDCLHYPGAERNFEAARLLEAAGRTGGIEGFWSMHAWLVVHSQEKSINDAIAAAESLKLDREKLAAEYAGNDARMAVQADIELGVSLRVNSAPTIFINGRQVPTAQPSRDLMERILAQSLHADSP